MTTLNSAFETELAQEDEGHESGSESFNIPTPHSRALRVYHVSTMENLSFDPANFGQSPTTQEHCEENSPQRYRCHSSTCCQLVLTCSDDEGPVRPQHSSMAVSSPAHRSADLSSPEYHHR